jgi:hypothetical protein
MAKTWFERKTNFCLSRAVAGVTQNLGHAHSLPLKSLKTEILAPGLIWANLMHFLLGILKFRFLHPKKKNPYRKNPATVKFSNNLTAEKMHQRRKINDQSRGINAKRHTPIEYDDFHWFYLS